MRRTQGRRGCHPIRPGQTHSQPCCKIEQEINESASPRDRRLLGAGHSGGGGVTIISNSFVETELTTYSKVRRSKCTTWYSWTYVCTPGTITTIEIINISIPWNVFLWPWQSPLRALPVPHSPRPLSRQPSV